MVRSGNARRLLGCLAQQTAAEQDPSWASVAFLLHFDGANGSTTFTDQKGNAWVRSVGTVALSTTNPKFGTAALHFTTTNDGQIQNSPAVAAITFPQVFTLEGWVNPTDTTLGATVGVGELTVPNGTQRVRFSFNSSGQLDCTVAGQSIVVAAAAFTDGQWHHLAFTRNASNAITVWVNGVSQGTASGSTTNSGTGVMYFGRHGGTSNCFVGRLDDWRYTPGVCRYTGTFSPPANAFPNS